MFDTHCHIDLPDFDEDREEVISRAKKAGFSHFMIPGIELDCMDKIIQITESNSNIYFASGIHPNNAAELVPDWAEHVRKNASHPKCKAIGEIGIDYYREYCPHDIQRKVFSQQLELASDLGLPIIIHCRTAYEDLWPLLSDWMKQGHGRKAVLHAFDEDAEKALLAVELGIMIGMGGPYTYKKKNERRIEIVQVVPMESILLETDCPYLSPIPHRGERNEPAYAALTLAKIAEIKGVSVEEADAQTTANGLDFFSIDKHSI
ncbi:MAG: TatD family hydrolase [Anaerolineaceae bacterium]|nr:TatD family hydrolase [Anaerolineaceae bacterium]